MRSRFASLFQLVDFRSENEIAFGNPTRQIRDSTSSKKARFMRISAEDSPRRSQRLSRLPHSLIAP